MAQSSKIGDIGVGVCAAHETPIAFVTVFTSGSPNVLTNGSPSSIIGTIGISTCGHPTVAILGSATVFANVLGLHRVGDIGTITGGVYVDITGSPNVLSG